MIILPGEYSLETNDSCMFGSLLSWRPLRLITRWLIFLMLLKLSNSSAKPDVEGMWDSTFVFIHPKGPKLMYRL